jgi:hypothetical protein
MREKDIQTQIINFLQYQPQTFIWRQNTGGMKSSYTHKTGFRKGETTNRFTKFGYPGISDVLGVYKSRFLAVEVKQEGKNATALQEAFLTRVYEAGGIAIVARSWEDVEIALKQAELLFETNPEQGMLKL